MKILYAVLVAIVATSVYSQNCEEPKCPDNCEFGIQHERDSVAQCKKCVCSPNPCKTKKCTSETVCKPRKDPKCVGQDCNYKKQAHCVAQNKDGSCPSILNAASKKSKTCSIDADCPGANKCCNSTCIAPCQTTRCTCQGKSTVNIHVNARGCQVCSCSMEGTTNNPCELQKDVGPCKAVIKKFYFDMESKTCKDFKYGGCAGNANRFDSKEACVKRCTTNTTAEARAIPKVEENICSQPKEVGPCRAAISSYYFDSVNKSCVEFKYGGCGGNQNNFETAAACESKCVKKLSKSEICALPSKPGNCRGSFQKFYYDAAKKSCQKFVYGGCNGNENSFDTVEACNAFCGNKPGEKSKDEIVKVNKCSLPMKAGPCRAFIQKYYFDSEAKACKQFVYGGCSGNENQFETEEECNKECGKKVVAEVVNKCSLPVKAGPCRASIQKYHFDFVAKTCKQFVYGGCDGNENQFETEEECKKECGMKAVDKCSLPKETGMCKAYMPKFHFDATSNSCKEFIYGGCGGNENRFNTAEECASECAKKKSGDDGAKKKSEVSEDVCKQPVTVGLCYALIPRFFFNQTTKSCESFSYGGCGGNGNNFETVEDCNARCTKKEDVKKNEEKIDSCLQPKKEGPCKALMPRFYFNAAASECQEFNYGGCQGNENNFETAAACEQRCPKQKAASNICNLKKDSGRCEALMPSYYFNAETKSCENFNYGGCGGNANRFETLMECQKKCSS